MGSRPAVFQHITTPQAKVELRRLMIPALFVLITLIVFASQSGGVGFWDKHHGWSSSHALAIMSRATPENFFVGHARTHSSNTGHIGYVYFDRYPFFFSALIGNLINLSDDLPTQVFIARQVMNVIFVLTMLFAFLLVNRLAANPLLALSIVLLTFSGYYLIYYRDMVHYDQPALLGMVILLYAIAVTKLEHKTRWRWLYIAAVVAVSLGRGYASYAVMGLWVLIEALGLLRRHDLSFGQRIRGILTHDSTRVLLLGLLWGGLMLSYNVIIEANRRDVDIRYTSIVDSALRRLPLDEEVPEFAAPGKPVPPWGEFAAITADRVLRWFTPVKYQSSDTAISPWMLPLILVALAVSTLFILRQPPARRLLLVLMAASGVLWIFFMIRLTYEHDYTTMYALGFGLVFYLAALSWLHRYRLAVIALLALSLALFALSSQRVYAENIDSIRASNIFTEDYNRVLHAIDGSKRHIYQTFPNFCAILNSKCYVLGFYLGDNYITGDLDHADYVLTSYIYHTSEPFLPPGDEAGLLLLKQSLTPENTVAHLFDMAQAEVRHLPENLAPMFHFADELSLNQWELRESVVVQPCQRVYIESWWQMQNPPRANYSMQIAMVDSSGQAVGTVNTNLTTVPTQVWVPDVYFLDSRPLQVPCDAPPGEYPLVMSVYDPEQVAAAGSLPVSLPDGTPAENHVYLTTLFIEG